MVQWLKGENPPKNLLKEYHIFEKLDRSTAFKFLRDLIRWIQEIGYTGLIILMDEAEQTPSMSTRQRETLLNNLRELVDACSKGTVMSTMIFYAVPDDSFLEGRTAVYEALNQRLATVFEGPINPTGVRIDLEHLEVNPEAFLREVGEKLCKDIRGSLRDLIRPRHTGCEASRRYRNGPTERGLERSAINGPSCSRPSRLSTNSDMKHRSEWPGVTIE
ncbi:MAG: DUF2791 family P-loop domain-containing protein [Methanoculleus sp.]